MKIFTSVLLIVAIFSSIGYSQTSLSGKITDDLTTEELIAANVCFYNNGILVTGIATDFDGNYHINLDPGVYNIEVSYVGYQTTRINGVVVWAGRNKDLDVTLGTGYYRYARTNWEAIKKLSIDFNLPEVLNQDSIREVLANLPFDCTNTK